MHSALKHDGKPLYEYARAGIDVERDERARDDPSPRRRRLATADLWTLDVACSKGTYIRTLAEDIGEALGCGAHLAALRRTGSGALTLERCDHARGARRRSTRPRRDALLLPPDALLADWPQVRLDDEARRASSPALRRRVALSDAPRVRVYGPEPRRLPRQRPHPGRRADLRPVCSARSKPATCSACPPPSVSRERPHDPTDPQHRHHRPRRPRQDDAGRPAAAPERHLPREREGGRARDGLATTSSASAASRSWPRTAPSSGRAPTSTSSTRPATPTSAARSSACCRWSTACCCWSTRSRGRCRRPASSRRRRSRSA